MVKVVELSGGVGGARLARGIDRIDSVDLTVVVNVGDDDVIHGLYVSADLDTVVYTLAGREGSQGWGRRGDTFVSNDELGALGADNRFRLGDLDLALNILRTEALGAGETLSDFTSRITKNWGIEATVIPATNDKLRTRVRNATGDYLPFQEYFVIRQAQDDVTDIEFDGAEQALPAPRIIEAIKGADVVVIGPSNPPLSIWPILAVTPIREAVQEHANVVAISPLFGGRPLKGPADRVMASLGLPHGNAGVAEAYSGLLQKLVIDSGDVDDAATIDGPEIVVANTHFTDPNDAQAFAAMILSL